METPQFSHRMILSFFLALMICSAALARDHSGAVLNPQGATGSSGNGLPGYAGYQYTCGLDGCFSASMTIVVPTLHYDTGPTGCSGGVRCSYVWPGIRNFSSNLAQDGITFDTDGAGNFSYQAWWECFPLNNVQFAFDGGATLHPNAGDTLNISLNCTNCTVGMAPPSPTSWTYTVNDVTMGVSVSKTGFNCPMNNDAFYDAFWTTENDTTGIVNFGTMNFSNVKLNGSPTSFSQSIHTRCSGLTCARYGYAAGTGATGTTVNPSVPNATGDAFNLCVNSNGAKNYGGTSNFAACSPPP